jgi:tetratricopeptide (TPR) repeat protein
MAPPKVFISYSHDSPLHEAKVLALSNRLRADGIDAVLDQYETFPPQGWIQWMKHQVRDARFVLVVCTETYRRRWDGEEEAGMGLGATYESGLILQLLYNASAVNERFVPVLLGEGDAQHIPLDLQRYTHYPVHNEGYERLYRLITGQSKVQKPTLGKSLPVKEAKPDFRNIFWNVPARNPFFTGRAAYLEAIHKALAHEASVALTQPQAISGLGGIGKTQTAIAYAHLHRAHYAAVFWSGADSRDALLSGFAAFANLLNLPQKDEPDLSVVAGAVRRWLETNSGWLMVLDNVLDLALVREFAPADAGGHLLITTRLRATGEFAESIELKKMEPDEGALFLLRRAKMIPKDQSLLECVSEVDRALARKISTDVDGLPLALDQAGAFVEETPSTLAEYLALYHSQGDELRARRGKLAPSHPSVTITFALGLARVAEANPAAADLVRACAFLAPDAIPEEIFTQGGREWGKLIAEAAAKPLDWVETIQEAGRFALIHRDVQDKSLCVHRLVQEVVKDGMDATVRCAWAQRVVQALNEVFPHAEFKTWPQCERLVQHSKMAARLVREFGLNSAAASRLLNASGLYLVDRAQYQEAEPFFRLALAVSEKALGPEHPDTASSLNNLALLYRNQGRYPEAEPLIRRAVAIDEKALGPEHCYTATTLTNLAALYDKLGRYPEAESLYRRALAIREKALGPEHSDTGKSLNHLR